MKTKEEINLKRSVKITELENIKITRNEMRKISNKYFDVDNLFDPIIEKIQNDIDIYTWVLN
jgi:hypothetical protein